MFFAQAVWFYNYFNVGEKVQQSVPFIYRKLIDVSHNALQNEVMYVFSVYTMPPASNN